ncbi:hypothetical protein BU26DRAFT_202731 [Trematosphaeria pertusa]|uniref:Uncharacterized protein n=1 Tax=Trematosphaeria pertusa TaxID=390896 RepID=A0A6A6HT15_9PLEO|nr:uncharacterized protein BU26DRAFT_202731 [Trematosphaeria pertusa]KAF2240580.1 hypothetical protein BU26DRAFT_202731 [Trematosphaeria pertusa]
MEGHESTHTFTASPHSTTIGQRHGTRFPPITKQSLLALETHGIVIDLKLRHDVNFDRELHFRPNPDG